MSSVVSVVEARRSPSTRLTCRLHATYTENLHAEESHSDALADSIGDVIV